MTITGTAGGPVLPAPYPFDSSCGPVPMAEVAENIRAAIRDASAETVMEMRMLGHVQDLTPADRRICLEIIATLQQLQALADKLPR